MRLLALFDERLVLLRMNAPAAIAISKADFSAPSRLTFQLLEPVGC